jgi:hypothetical protein
LAAELAGKQGSGKAFLIAAAVMLEAIAAACSSPQTTELNAEARSKTLMKWVTIGLALGAGLTIAGAVIDAADDETANNSGAILAGGLITGGVMWLLYRHAQKAGVTNPGQPTESYG